MRRKQNELNEAKEDLAQTSVFDSSLKHSKRKPGRPAVIDKFRDDCIIDPILNETLYRLWIDGKNLTEIVKMYSTTQTRFSLEILSKTALRFKWKERRAELLEHIIKINNEQILIDKRKQIEAVSRMIDMNLHIIEDAYMDYLKSPKKFFENQDKIKKLYWLVGDVDKLKELFSFYEKVISQNNSRQNDSDNEKSNDGSTSNNSLIIHHSSSKQIREKFYTLLKESADLAHTDKIEDSKLISHGTEPTDKR